MQEGKTQKNGARQNCGLPSIDVAQVTSQALDFKVVNFGMNFDMEFSANLKIHNENSNQTNS